MTTDELRAATGAFDRPSASPAPKAKAKARADPARTLEQLLAEAEAIRDRAMAMIKRMRQLDAEIAAARAARAARADGAAKRRRGL
jgi:hypothetical protein